MALEPNAYLTSAATTDGVIPNLYNEQAEKYLYEKEILRPLCKDMSYMILGKPGNSFQTFKETEFSVSPLTEGTDTPVSALDFNSVTLTINWYGDAKQISKENLASAFPFVLNDLRYGASNALAVNRDEQIMTEFLNTASSAIYPISSGTTRYTSADITADASITYEQIMETWKVMRLNRRDLKYVVVHPKQFKDLSQTEYFINNKYDQISLNGEVGRIMLGSPGGIKIIVSAHVQSVQEGVDADADGIPDVTVYQAIGLAENSVIYAQKVSPVFEFDEEYKRKRGLTFHYYEAFGVKILHDEGVVPIKSA